MIIDIDMWAQVFKGALSWVKSRAKEASTLRGVIGVACGAIALYHLARHDMESATGTLAAAGTMIGLVNSIRKENKTDDQS